jgi:hypothetical protein
MFNDAHDALFRDRGYGFARHLLQLGLRCRYYTDMHYCCGLAPTLPILRRLPKTRLGCNKYTVCRVSRPQLRTGYCFLEYLPIFCRNCVKAQAAVSFCNRFR